MHGSSSLCCWLWWPFTLSCCKWISSIHFFGILSFGLPSLGTSTCIMHCRKSVIRFTTACAVSITFASWFQVFCIAFSISLIFPSNILLFWSYYGMNFVGRVMRSWPTTALIASSHLASIFSWIDNLASILICWDVLRKKDLGASSRRLFARWNQLSWFLSSCSKGSLSLRRNGSTVSTWASSVTIIEVLSCISCWEFRHFFFQRRWVSILFLVTTTLSL